LTKIISVIKKARKIIGRLLLSIFVLLLIASILLALPVVQTKLANYATEVLNKDFGTNISVEKVAVSLFGGVDFKGVLALDHHNDTLFYINRLKTNILDTKALYNKGHPYFGTLKAEGLDCKIRNYKGEKDTNLDHFIDAFDDGKPSSGRFRLKSNLLVISKGRFRYIDDNEEDTRIVDFKNLEATLRNFFIKGANVYATIKNLSFLDHRNILVEKLSADFTYTKQFIELKEFYLQTPFSNLKGDAKLSYNRKDFANFNNKVLFTVKLQPSILSTTDLNGFYNEFAPNQKLYLTTNFVGVLNNFTLKNLRLMDENQTEVVGNLTLKNAFGKNNQSFVLGGNFDKLSTNYFNLKKLMPNILGKNLPEMLARLGDVDLAGTMEVSRQYLKSAAYVLTDLGEAQTDLRIDNLENIEYATYKGTVELENFDVGTLVNDSKLQQATLRLTVDGKGFSQKALNTTLQGTITNFYYNGYNYQNIEVDGTMKMPYFKGNITSNDPNAQLTFKGLIDLSKPQKIYDFYADVSFADLKKLKINTKDSISTFKGEFVLNAVGTNFDDLKGELYVNKAVYKNTLDTYSFQDFMLSSVFDEQKVRTISLNSPDIINGKVVGSFKINQVDEIVENALGSLYANYSPNKLLPKQFLDFDLTIHNKIVEIFYPEIAIGKNTHIKGKINADEGKFKLDFSANAVKVFDNYFHNIKLDIDNKNPLFNAYIEMDSLRTNNYKLSEISLINITEKDTLFFRTEAKGGEKAEDFYNLNLYHTIDKDKKSIVGIKKSELNFKNSLWYLNEEDNIENKLIFNQKIDDFSIENVILSHNQQKITLNGYSKGKTDKDIQMSFKDVDLHKISPRIDSLQLAGNLNGIIDIKQQNSLFQPTSLLKVDNFAINSFVLGDLDLEISGDESLRKFNILTTLSEGFQRVLKGFGTVELTDDEPLVSLDVSLQELNISPFGPLLADVFSNMHGFASGTTKVVGKISEPNLYGTINLENAGLQVPYLNVDYDFDSNFSVALNEKSFIFNPVTLTDTKFKTKGILNGTIKHKKFQSWDIDFKIKSNKILGLNTQDSEDALYYGTAFLDGYAHIFGNTDALNINIEGSSEAGTKIKIPIADTESITESNFIQFTTPEEKYTTIKNKKSEIIHGITLDLNFDINRNAEIEVILNRNSGHAMRGVGAGSIRMQINTLGNFNIWGDFQVYQGVYNFALYGLFTKKFEVKKFGTIRWDGDPYKAILDIQAVYKTEANPALLLESASFNKKVPTEVVISLNGDLMTPEPNYQINFPTVSSVLKSEIEYKLIDKEAREKQAIMLLATGSFLSPEGLENGALYSTLFERASTLFDDVFSNENSKVKFGINYSLGDRIYDQADKVGLNFRTQLNDRITINGRVGVPVGNTTNATNQNVVGNVEATYRINEDGTFNARMFNRENDINYIGENIGYTQGLGLTYSVDFDNFRELWQKIFTPRKPEDEVEETDKNKDKKK